MSKQYQMYFYKLRYIYIYIYHFSNSHYFLMSIAKNTEVLHLIPRKLYKYFSFEIKETSL